MIIYCVFDAWQHEVGVVCVEKECSIEANPASLAVSMFVFPVYQLEMESSVC